MKIRLVGHSGEAVMPVGRVGPWFDFLNTLKSFSNDIAENNYGELIEALVANSHSLEAIKECDLNKVPKDRRILILWEPKIVNPKTYARKTLKNYGKIFTPSVDWAEKINAESFFWPQLDLENYQPDFSNWEERENKASIVLANKFSACKGELYSLRREIAYRTQDNDLLDLYGSKWNLGLIYDFRHYFGNVVRTPFGDIRVRSCRYLMRKFRNFKGLSKDKFKTMENYRISVVIENSADYVSEKLFDSVASGAITIYVGPRIEKYGLDGNSVIHCEPNSKEVMKRIRYLQSIPLDEQLKIAQLQYSSLLKSSASWECHEVLRDLASRINRYLASTESISK
jgi:hypothetical protein